MHPLESSFRNICNRSDAKMMSSDDMPRPNMERIDSSNDDIELMKGTPQAMVAGGHMMSADDPENPQNWPVLKKIHASAVAWAFTWIV